KAVVIAAAIRTPNTLHLQKSTNQEYQLVGIVIDELVKRTTVPRDEFKKLIVCASGSSDSGSNDALSSVAMNLGLKSCQTHVIKEETCSASGLQMSLECLQRDEKDWIILGDTRTNININFTAQDVLASELITPSTISLVNPTKESSMASPAAAALALTTAQMAERLQLQPLALVREFFIEKDNLQTIFRRGNNQLIQLNDVHTWHLVMPHHQHNNLGMLIDLNVNDVHIHDAQQITASHLLTHTVHALPAGRFGCIIMDSANGRECLLMVLEKLIPKTENLPQITLYTKEPCPLCDSLVEQLHEHFAGEFELNKVFIDRKENVRFLRLFRYDIPVLFLNGQFLCMHRLNENALRERLATIN
ncbi:hypothetical protein KR044_007513, partial [Drosophila immigrans]